MYSIAESLLIHSGTLKNRICSPTSSCSWPVGQLCVMCTTWSQLSLEWDLGMFDVCADGITCFFCRRTRQQLSLQPESKLTSVKRVVWSICLGKYAFGKVMYSACITVLKATQLIVLSPLMKGWDDQKAWQWRISEQAHWRGEKILFRASSRVLDSIVLLHAGLEQDSVVVLKQ